MTAGYYQWQDWNRDWDGLFLREARRKKKISQKQLAELTGIAVSDISQMENGSLSIDKATEKRLAKALGDTVCDDPFDRIRTSLSVDELSDKIKKALQDAHKHFAVDNTMDLSRPSRSRSCLKKIEKHSTMLIKTLDSIDDLTFDSILKALPNTKAPSVHDLQRDLGRLKNRASIAIKKLPVDRRGPDEKVWPLRTLIGKLKLIYQETTGKKATLIKQLNDPQGTFFNFIKTFLDIVEYKAWSDIAIMRTIEEVIYPPKSL